MPKINITKLVEDALLCKSESELTEEQHNLLRLCRLMVDIEYAKIYGQEIATE